MHRILVAVVCLATVGCAALRPLEGIPVRHVPHEVLAPSRNDLRPIDLSLLRQTPSPVYRVDANDILGIFVEGILGRHQDAPPVHYATDPNQVHAVGYPIAVRPDGTISLPLVAPLPVRGMSLAEVEAAIRRAYVEQRPLLKPGQDRILVSLQRPRTYRVLVIRDEGGNQQPPLTSGMHQYGGTTGEKRGIGRSVALPAGRNDVLNALAETGGLPGLDAENVVYVMRGRSAGSVCRMPGIDAGTHLEPAGGTVPGTANGPRGPIVPTNRSAWAAASQKQNAAQSAIPLPKPVAPPRSASPSNVPIVRGQSPEGLWPPATVGPPTPRQVVQSIWLPPQEAGAETWPVQAPHAAPVMPSLPAPSPSPVPYAAPPMIAPYAPAPWPMPAPGAVPYASPQPASPPAPAPLSVPATNGPQADAPFPWPDLPPGVAAPSWSGPVSIDDATIEGSGVLRIPLRLRPGETPQFAEQDILLQDGDVVYVQSRQTDFFYTGGLLGGGRYALPRDYDLDVLSAITTVQTAGLNTTLATRAVGGVSALNQDVTIGASRVVVLRRLDDGRQIPIQVDLYRAVRHPEERITILPGDYVVLEYTRVEAVFAFIERHLLDGTIVGWASNQLYSN